MNDHAALITRAEDDIKIWSTTFGRNDLIRDLIDAIREADTRAGTLETILRQQNQSHHFAAGSL